MKTLGHRDKATSPQTLSKIYSQAISLQVRVEPFHHSANWELIWKTALGISVCFSIHRLWHYIFRTYHFKCQGLGLEKQRDLPAEEYLCNLWLKTLSGALLPSDEWNPNCWSKLTSHINTGWPVSLWKAQLVPCQCPWLPCFQPVLLPLLNTTIISIAFGHGTRVPSHQGLCAASASPSYIPLILQFSASHHFPLMGLPPPTPPSYCIFVSAPVMFHIVSNVVGMHVYFLCPLWNCNYPQRRDRAWFPRESSRA